MWCNVSSWTSHRRLPVAMPRRSICCCFFGSRFFIVSSLFLLSMLSSLYARLSEAELLVKTIEHQQTSLTIKCNVCTVGKHLPMWPSVYSTRAPCAVERDMLTSRGSNLSLAMSAYQIIPTHMMNREIILGRKSGFDGVLLLMPWLAASRY